jgi:ribosomal-protein-alanine N-acetyltransferase
MAAPLDVQGDYQIRRATLLDLNPIYKLEKSIFPRDAYTRLELFIQFMLLPRARNFRLVNSEGNIIGFCGAMDNIFPGRPAWIITLGIAKEYQGQGLGRYLLDFGERQLGAKRVRLTVRVSNYPAISLYESHGYIHRRRLRRYYPGGEDGLEMEKWLD